MQLRVLFFGATADIVGDREIRLAVPAERPVSAILHLLLMEHPILSRSKLLFALNQKYVTGDEIICDGDELAIFTAVSGG